MKKRLLTLFVSIMLSFCFITPTAQATFGNITNDDLLFFRAGSYMQKLQEFDEHPYKVWYDGEEALNMELTDLAIWYCFERYNTKIIPQNFKVKTDEVFTKEEEKVVASGRKKLLDFIDITDTIKSADKKDLKSYIVSIKFELADFPESAKHLTAVYELGNVYVNVADRHITEWVVIHELLHAVKDYLSEGKDWLQTGKFVEGMTDALTFAINGDPFVTEQNGYTMYREFAFMFLSVFGTKGAQAFLYGNMESELGLDHAELDLMIQCLNHAEDPEYGKSARSVATNCLKNMAIDWQSKSENK